MATVLPTVQYDSLTFTLRAKSFCAGRSGMLSPVHGHQHWCMAISTGFNCQQCASTPCQFNANPFKLSQPASECSNYGHHP